MLGEKGTSLRKLILRWKGWGHLHLVRLYHWFIIFNTLWPDILQTALSNAVLSECTLVHISLTFIHGVPVTNELHFSHWLGANHYLNKWWPFHWFIYASLCHNGLSSKLSMMTSSNGNIFRVTGHLCGEFIDPRWIPAQRPVTRSFDVFFDLRLNKWLSKQSWGWWLDTLSHPLWRHCNALLNTKRTDDFRWKWQYSLSWRREMFQSVYHGNLSDFVKFKMYLVTLTHTFIFIYICIYTCMFSAIIIPVVVGSIVVIVVILAAIWMKSKKR